MKHTECKEEHREEIAIIFCLIFAVDMPNCYCNLTCCGVVLFGHTTLS